jgi:hypothetical protein
MNASTRSRSAWSAAVGVLALGVEMAGLVSCVTVLSAVRAEADVVVRLTNGREIIAREHWFVQNSVSFTHGGGTVTVPRASVAAIVAVGAVRQIGGGPKPVNAPELVAPEPFR